MNVGLRSAIVAVGSAAWLWTAFASGLLAQAGAKPGSDPEVSFDTHLEKTAV